VLIGDVLPGPIAEQYRKNGLALASSVQVLDTDPGADLMIYWYIGVGGVLIGFAMLISALVTRARVRPTRRA
jgi:hypothetical protein